MRVGRFEQGNGSINGKQPFEEPLKWKMLEIYMKISKATIRFFAGLNEGCLQHNGGQSCHKRVVHPQPFPATWPRAPKGESEQPPSHKLARAANLPYSDHSYAKSSIYYGLLDRLSM